ncbi:MAG: hypothetical protein IKC40_04035, partial [Oscillospiraceae bacterium]|nr:hypothetical protein [Oscillospiraceae bacterium]
MIVANGMVYDSSQQEMILSTLETRINETRMKAQLDPEIVISAFDTLSRSIGNDDFPEFSE